MYYNLHGPMTVSPIYHEFKKYDSPDFLTPPFPKLGQRNILHIQCY